MAGTISFSGLSASGLDTSSWVDALVSVKQQTITSLEQQKAEKENLLSIVNNIKSYFSSFQTCLQKITDSQYGIASMDLFMQNLALSSNSSIATATATTEAARQSYDVAVDSLATATKATSGYSQIEVKTADLNTTFGTLGGKNGTITVNSQSFNVTTEDTLQNLIDKFKNVGVDAKFDENKGTFTIGMDLDKIDEGATNLKNALRLANNNVSGAVSGSVVYANRNTEFYKLGLNGGDINIEGVKHTITKNGNDYTIQKDGGAAVQMNTLGEFLDYLKSSAVGADDATVDAKGHITIKGATLDKVEGGTNLIDVLNLIESQKRTVSESGALSYIEVRVADLNTKLSALGITGDTTLVAGGTNNTISNDKTLGDIKNILKNAGVDMSVDSRGIITIDTHGNEISGTLLDVLNLDPTKGGTTISSSVHQATLKADGNTKLSELGISSDKKYTAYKSDGTALTTEISNVEGQTVDEFVNALKNSGLDAKFDEKTHQITIKDGYIEGSLADALGMTQLSTSFTENASLNTQLEKLGATGDSTLTIDGGAAKTYDKNTTLETVFNDIKNAGGKVTFKDGNVTIEGVTLGGSLPSLLGLDATTQGTSVTSGKLTAVTGSTSSGGNTESTVEHNIELSTKLGDITGTTSNYTLKVGDGASTTYTKDSTLQDIKTQIETAGGKFTINDDNTISIEGVTMSGTVVGALGFDELATGTKFTTVDAVMISGTSNVATGGTTLGNLGLVVSGSTSGARAVRRAPANPNKTLSINGGTAKTYGADASLDDIFADIVAAGGTASINSEGYIVIDGVHLEGTLVDALGLVETSYKTTITSGDLKVTTSTKSTSSSALYTDTKGDIAWDSTIGSIVGDTNSYDLKVNGTNKTYNTNTKLSDIKNVIQAAGGTMTINDDNTISINGVEISGSLVDKLGFNSDGVHTVVSSNNPIYYTDGKKSADTGTTFEQLGISSSKRDYAIYKNDGTEVKASSTDGTNSGKTIGDWLKVVNDSLNTANGTSDITYASINNGVISITGGYVTGSLPTELGIGTKETVTGITMEGSSVSYVEYDPLKYIGNTQTGSGIAAGTMVTSGFMTEAMQYKDELGNIHAVTETTKLSEVLDTSGNKIGSGSYTFNVGSYTKTFDADSTTLGDIVNYVNNLNMDTTHDTTTSATLVDGKLTIESNVSITGTLLGKLGFEKQDVSSVAYEIKGTQKAHYKKNDGVTVTASGFSTAVTTQSTSGADKVYVSSLSDFVSGSTYYVKSASDLNKLAELTNAGKNTSGVTFVLENDVDLAGQQFVPIGTYNNSFKGNFYGNGHVIKNLTITDTSVLSDPYTGGSTKVYYAGLFGVIDGAKLYDIGLENVNINLSIDGDDSIDAGALAGVTALSSEINNCYSTGSVSTDGYAGGLVVGVATSSSVSNSYSTVNVSGNIVGGLVAYLFAGKISNSFATGNVDGTTAGGLVGDGRGITISNSFATGNANGTTAGGLVGIGISGKITISDSFATGNVTGAESQGGVVAITSATNTTTTVTNCGYSGSTGLDSGVSSGATAMTDAQLKSSIEGLGISSATVVNKTVDTTATTSTTIKELMGKGGEQAFNFYELNNPMSVSRRIAFAETDTIQTVIDKLKEFGFDEVDLVDGIFRIKDDKKWSFYGSSELVNKLFGGDDRTYGAEGPQVTYQVTQSSVGSYTGNKITYTTTTTGSAGSVTGNQLSYNTTTTGSAGSVTGNQLTYTTTTTGSAGSVTGNKLTYTTTTGSAGSVIGNFLTYTTTTTTSGKTYSGDVVNTVPKGYSTDTKLVDIDSSYNGSEMYVYKKPSSALLVKNEKVKTLTINSNTTIQDVIEFYKPYLVESSSPFDPNYTYSLADGTLTLKFQTGYSSYSRLAFDNNETISFGTTTPTVATTSTKLYELETSPSTTANIKVVNNGKEYSFDAGSFQNASPTIQDVLDFLNNTAGCTATFTDGKLTVSGASDLEFKKPGTTTSNGVTYSNHVYDMSKLFGGNMPTSTPSIITTTHTATGSTKMSELGVTDFTVNGSALSGITNDSTINDVLAKLKSTYGLSEATFSDGKITLKSNSNTTLSGNLIKGLMGQDSVSITAGLVATPASKTGNKVTYSATKSYSGTVVKTAAKGYSTDTKLVDIDSSYNGSEMYVYEQRSSSSGTILPFPGNINGSGTSKPLENQNTNIKVSFDKVATLSIDSNTTIQNVIDFYEPYLVEKSNVFDSNYTYSLADGTLTLKFKSGYSLHEFLSVNELSNDTISFGTTTPTVATTSTKLSDLEISPSDFKNIELVNNGKKYSLDVRLSYQTTIQDVLDFLNDTAGCTATFTDGKLTVTGAGDLEFKKPSTIISNGESLQDFVYDMSVLFGGSIPTGTASTSSTRVATDSTTMFELGLSPTLKVDGKDITGLSSSSTVGQVLSALKSQYGIDGSISDGKMTLTSSSAHTVSGDVINKFFGSDSISLTPTTTSTGGSTTTQTATGSTKMSELGITDFTVNGSALSGITGDSTINDVLAKLKSTYGLSEATISDGKITLKSNSNITLSGNLIKVLMGQDSVSITASSVTTPASQTGNKVTYTKSTTTNTGYKYTAADYNSGSVYHAMMKDFRLVSFTDTNTTYNSPQGQMLTGRTITGVDKDGLSFSIVIEDNTTLELFDNQLYGYGFRLTQVDAGMWGIGMWGIAKADTDSSGSIDIGDLAYQGSYDAAKYVAVIGKVVLEESGVPYTSTTKYTADSSTTMSDLGLSPTLKVDGKDITGLSSSSTVGEVLSALKSQYGIDGSISDGKMTLTSSSSHTVSGDVINKFFGSDSISLTPTTSGGGSSTHTATGSTKMSELGITDFTVKGSALSGITSNSTINDVLAKLKSTYGLSEATISDGKVTLKSNSYTTLSGNLIKGLTGKDSVSINPSAGDTTTHTATGSTTLAQLGVTDFTVKGSALSGITSNSTINDVLAKLKSTYGLSEATISDGKVTLKSNSYTTLSGNLIKGLTGKDSVSINPSAGDTTTHTATGSTTLAQLGVTDFKVNGSALSGITNDSTINDVLAKLKSTYGLSEATISDGKVTLKSNGNTTLSGNLINRLTGQDSVSLTAKSSKTCSGDVVKTAAKGYSTDTKLVDIDSSYKGNACVVFEQRTVIGGSGVLRPDTDIKPEGSGSSSGGNLNGNTGSIITKPNGGSTKIESVEIAKLTINENTTIQDVIDFYNNYGTCSYSEETGDISTSPNKNYSFFHPFNMSESGDFNIGKTTPKTATTSTTLGELEGLGVGRVIRVVNNGKEYTSATSKSTTIQDVLDFLNNTVGCTATFTDGKLTVTGGSDLEFKTTTDTGMIGPDGTAVGMVCYQMSTLFGGNMTTSTTSATTGTITTTYTADTTTKLGASGLGLTSFDLQIEPLGDAEPISISGLNGDSTIGDVFKKLAEKGITASMNNGVITLTSNTLCDLTGTIAKKLFGNDIVELECTDEIHDFTMTQVSGTKYQYVSRNLTANSSPERVSEVSQLVAGNKYHISSAEDLVALANFVKNGADTTGSIFMFDNDIDMSGVTGFEGIGTLENAFKGTVYGNGHVVKNMTINTTSIVVGLFGYTNQATIKDLGVVDANVTGDSYTGILVGKAENSQISNVYTSGTVTSNGSQIGGLTGELKNSTATNVYSTADVKGNLNVGGLIGDSGGSIVEKAFATGKVTATEGQVGGLIGAMENGGTVKNSYATGDVNGAKFVGGFVGYVAKASITYTFDTVYSTGRANGSEYVGGFVGVVRSGATVNIKNAVYNRSTGVEAIGGGSATGILGKDYEQMIQKSVMQNAGFTEDKGWVYSANSTPIFGNTTVTGGGKTYLDSSITSLTSGSTYYISTLEQLNNLATLVNNGADTSGVNFVLDNDIDVSSFTHIIMDFEGTFYGNGHSLTGLKTALFSTVGGNAIVRDLALENMSESGILAYTVTDNSIIDNVYSTGSTNSRAGLIDTLNGNATLKNSYSTANIIVTSGFVGGLVGLMSDNATIENCFAQNTIKQTCAMSMNNHAGGLVGDVSGGTIKSSYADCNINVVKYSSVNTTAGGLIGKTSGNVTVENCYATGSRTAEKTDRFIGQNDGNVTSNGNVACTGTIYGIGITSGFSDGVTFVSNPELNSQARMEELGFTKDKGWVYYSGKAPMLQGKDTSSAGTEHQIDTKSTLDSICKNRENKTLTVTINGETHSKTFKGSDTVGDVANWLNGIDGVTANVSNSKFNISGASQDFRVDGELADVLFGNNKTITNQTITENTDSNGLMVDGGQKKIDNNTTVGQLLGVTSGKYAITYIDDSGNLQSGKFSSDEKLSEVLKFLNDNGFQASIVNGVFTATKDGKIATNISGTIGEKLKGENGTVTNSSSGYKTGQLDASSSTKATATTKLADLGIASGSIFIKDNNNNTLGTIQIDNSMTIDDTAQLLANYGFTLGITDGKVTIEGNGTNRIADGTSNLVSQMKLNNWIETKDKLKTDSTVAQMGFGKGSTLGLVLDNKTYNLTFDANATLQDIIDTLGTYGVTASVDNNGKFTASASGNLVLTNELGAYLTKNSAEGYVKEADGYKSKDPLEFKGDKVKLDYDSKVGDILGTGKDGVLRLTLNKDTVVDLTYKADDTMADIIADLKGYGITATIDDGVLNATSNDKTFRLSGEIGKIISGDTPQYDDISTGYVSKDLSYETTNKTNMNNTLKEMGVSSGQIHVLSNDGKIVSTLDIDNSYTVAQVKSLLQPFGMTLSVDENGKFTVASAEGYKLSDSTSNMVSKMGLNNWTTATEKLSGATTLAQMGFKDGADLNLFLDGAVMNVLSFDANQTVDDIIFGLAAYGIDASVNADGQFTATSKSHTFIMSGGLGSYLTKGTGGYVNSDTAYESYKPLVESKDYVETASKGLDYKDIMTEGSTLESLGFAQGGTVRVMLDGKTPYTLQFLATDKVQDVIYALSAYGINAEVKDGRFVAESVNNTFTLTGNLGSYFVEGGAYQNEVTGYESKPLTYETTEKLTNDTKLSDLGITRGDINVIKDGKVADTIHISDDTTIGQLFSAIKPYGMTGEIVTKANGDTSIRISADSDIKLADGTSNVVSGLGLQNVRKGDFEGMKKYWDDDATSGLITEDTLLSTLDRNGFIAQGSLIFNTGEGDDAVQHIINISANETVGSLLKKFNDSGIKATLDDGVIKLTGGLDKLTFTGGTSGLVETIGLDIHNIDKYASSSSALTYEGETHYSASNFANASTKLDIVNATDGNMSIFVDGVKCNIEVKSSDSFADLFKKIKDTVKARTGLDIQAGFKTKDGSISANPTDANNTGIIGLEIEKGHELVVGASNDTTNFATIANLNKTDYNAVTGSRALYRVNVNSLITESGLYRDGDITEGTFKIGDAEFTIDSTTTLASLINQINKNDKAYASAYWDTLAGTLVIESTVTGASLINIEAGTSNFTDIMGFTKTKDGVSALVTDSQTLGQNAVVRINGTTVTSATNVITSDISKIKGLTINLKNVSAGETVTISVEQDKEAIYNAVSDTLDAYNSMMEALGKELADKKSLGGESILKLMRNNLKRLMTSSLTGAYVFKNLASVGISTGEASDKITTNVTSLLIDKDKFMDALNTDSDAVQDLLVGTKANPGIFLQANNIVENSINTDGYFSNMANTLTKSINNIEKKISKNNLAIENYRTKLETKFHNMELTISGLQSAYANILK